MTPEQAHIASTNKRLREIISTLDDSSKAIANDIAMFGRIQPPESYTGSFFTFNQSLKRRIDEQLATLRQAINTGIESGMSAEWSLSNEQLDAVVDDMTKGRRVPTLLMTSMRQANLDALDAFINRKLAGMNLSNRVWNISRQSRRGIESYLSTGITRGRSAAAISRDVRDLLKDPDRLFRRVANEKGELVASQAMRAFHPGTGVYKSAYQNALRLTATEINMAYRVSESTRRQQLPFIMGIEVHLSNSHPRPDICDSMQGTYPKDFVFSGWHPRCICYTKSVMMSLEEFDRYLDTGRVDRRKLIRAIPQRAQQYIAARSEKLAKANPYWLRDNAKLILGSAA